MPTAVKAEAEHSIRSLLPGALVFCATIIAYLPALKGAFIWNDSDYVTEPKLRSFDGLVRIWTEPGATQQYYPVLHSAFWVQHRLFGDHPLGYHIVSLLLHAGSALLFAIVLRRVLEGATAISPRLATGPQRVRCDSTELSGNSARSHAGIAWLAALLFALHPVHVESVAWITEQKNTLSLALYLAATAVYLHFDRTRRPREFAAALGLFVLSLGAKTVTATLPAALLVVLWWKRGRLEGRRDIWPLLPWIALGATAGLFSSWIEQKYVGAQGLEFALPLLERGLVAGRAIWFYAGQIIWPFHLNFIYARWTADATVWWQWLFPFGVVVAGAALWILRQRSRAPLATFLFFIGSLFPVLGFVNLYGARYSWVWDHWQYLADLGPFALIAAGLIAVWRTAERKGAPRWLGWGLAGGLAGALGVLAWSHCAMFRDDSTLFRTTLERNPDCWMAHDNLGTILADLPGRLPDAIAHYEDALRLKPESAETHNNLGLALAKIPKRLPDAIAQFQTALRLRPGFVAAHNNLGDTWSKIPGHLPDAIAQFDEALRLQPDHVGAHNNLGLAWARMPDRLPDAIAQFQAALRLEPDNATIHNNLGSVLLTMPGHLPAAVSEFEHSLRIQPDNAQTHFYLGIALIKIPERVPDAISQFQTALRLQPDFAQAHNSLGLALAMTPERMPDAIDEFESALHLQPDLAEAHYNLGLAWAQTPGRLPDAIAQLEKTVRLQPDHARAWHDLGACQAQSGNWTAAVAAFREALRLKPDDPEARQSLAIALRHAGA